jgi:hypothetical protein
MGGNEGKYKAITGPGVEEGGKRGKDAVAKEERGSKRRKEARKTRFQGGGGVKEGYGGDDN